MNDVKQNLDHPLIQLLSFYYDRWEGAEDIGDEDLPALTFQQQYGLAVDIPVGWPYVEAVDTLVKKSMEDLGTPEMEHIVIIYPTSKIYKEVYQALGDNACIKYFPWHEVYVAMDIASVDQRELSHLRGLLGKSGLTIFIGAPTGFPEVTNQVRRMCPGRLVILRTFDEKER